MGFFFVQWNIRGKNGTCSFSSVRVTESLDDLDIKFSQNPLSNFVGTTQEPTDTAVHCTFILCVCRQDITVAPSWEKVTNLGPRQSCTGRLRYNCRDWCSVWCILCVIYGLFSNKAASAIGCLFLSCSCSQCLYRIESLQRTGHSVTAAVLGLR